MNKYIKFLIVPIMLLGVNGNSCYSIDDNTIFNARIQYSNIQSLFYKSNFHYCDMSFTNLLKQCNISNDFINDIKTFYNNLLRNVLFISDYLCMSNNGKESAIQMFTNTINFVQNLQNSIQEKIKNKTINNKEIENYIIQQTNEYYNIVKEFVNNTLKNLNSYNLSENNRKDTKILINNIINMKNNIIISFFTLISHCIAAAENNLCSSSDFEEIMSNFYDGIEKICEEYNLDKDVKNELIAILDTFWRMQCVNDFLDRLQEMVFDMFQEEYGNNYNDIETLNFKKVVKKYTDMFLLNSRNTLISILKCFKNNLSICDLNGNISEICKIIIENIMSNIEKSKEILQQMRNDSLLFNVIEKCDKDVKTFINNRIDYFINMLPKNHEELNKRIEKQLTSLNN